MGFFNSKTTCSVCNIPIGLNRYLLSKNTWICQNCLNKLGGPSAISSLKTKSISELKSMLNFQPSSDVITATSVQNNVEAIEMYKKLLDSGAITQEDYEKKKNELLNSKVQTSNVFKSKNKNESTSNRKNIVIIVSFMICAFIIFMSLIIAISKGGNSINKNLLINQYNLSEEEAQNIISIIDKCGYSDYYSNYTLEKSSNNEEIPDSIGFAIKSGNQIVGFIDIKDNKVDNIQYSDKILYKNGSIQHTLSEYLISADEERELIVKAQEDIESVLKSPSTAKFPWPDEWKMSKKSDSITIQSYVDAQNSFGAVVRSEFQIIYKKGKITSLILDGKEYIKKGK